MVVSSIVSEAAERFAAVIIRHAGGQLPPADDQYRGQWLTLCRRIGLVPVGLEQCPHNFTARLEYDAKRDLWVWVYNRNRSAYEKACFFCHEAGEYLCLADMPELHRELNGRVYNYTGDPDPSEIHHRVGREVEKILMKKDDERGGDDAPPPEVPEYSREAIRLRVLTEKISLFKDQIGVFHRQIDSLECDRLAFPHPAS